MDKEKILKGLSAEAIAYINILEERIKELEQRIEKLTEQFLLAQKSRYAPKSEKGKYIFPGGLVQESLFNEAEAVAEEEPAPPEPEIIIKQHARKQKRTKAELSKELPVKKEVIDIPENERVCNICEGELHRIGEEFVRSELSIIPAQAYMTETYQVNYACSCCAKETDEANIIKPDVPKPIIKRGLASPSSAAHIFYQKYVNSQPLYRQQEDWKNFGVIICRGTLANWIIYISSHWLAPLWEAWKGILLTAPVIFADETVTQVLKEPEKTPQSKSRMWVYATGRAGPAPIVLYEYKPDRGGENAKQFLSGARDFYLQTDGYAGYKAVENAIHCGCWAHLRRKFNEAMPKSPPKDNPAYIGMKHCQKLFDIERTFDEGEITPEERFIQRQEKSKPALDDFFAWVKTLNPLAGSKLAEAVTYAKNQEEPLSTFLKDGHLDISTNRVENAIRPFALGRKNWLFADTVAGANASAVAYSITETAKLNGINPYDYLLYIFSELPSILTQNPDADLSPFFPWDSGIAQRCRALKDRLHNSFLSSLF